MFSLLSTLNSVIFLPILFIPLIQQLLKLILNLKNIISNLIFLLLMLLPQNKNLAYNYKILV